MGAPLALRSETGRGSVFTLELPLGKAPRAAAQAVPGKGPIGITLDGRLIVVVEDEPAVREGPRGAAEGLGRRHRRARERRRDARLGGGLRPDPASSPTC